MKYILMLMFSATSEDFPKMDEWTPDEIAAHVAYMDETNAALVKSGEFVATEGLADPATARIVRAGADHAPVVTEGPFAETREFLAGYWIVDVATADRALEVAALLSAAPGGGGRPLGLPIEVRQIMTAPAPDSW